MKYRFALLTEIYDPHNSHIIALDLGPMCFIRPDRLGHVSKCLAEALGLDAEQVVPIIDNVDKS